MKYAWVLVLILSVIAGTAVGELTRKLSYGWVDSTTASYQVAGGADTEVHCIAAHCSVCFDADAVPEMRDTLCTSTPAVAVVQPFSASAVTALLLLGFSTWEHRRGRRACRASARE